MSLRSLPAHMRARFSRSVDYKIVFGSEAGKRVYADLMRFCGMNMDPMMPGQSDETAYNLGKHRVGLRISSFLDFDERAALAAAEAPQPQHGEDNDA